MKKSLNSLVVLWLLVLTGCGFHLRGSMTLALPDNLKTISIEGINLNRGLGRELKRSLTNAGVSVVAGGDHDALILTILENNIDRRVLSVGSDAKVSEYELRAIVRFSVKDKHGTLLENQQVEGQRDYQFDKNQVLSSEEEENLLRQQLNQQLIQSILRYLFALKTSDAD